MPKLKKIGKIVWACSIFITVCSTLDPWLATSRQVPHRLLAPLPKARLLHSVGTPLPPPPHAPLLSTEKCANTLFSSFHWRQETLATFWIRATCHTKKKDLTPAKKLFLEDGCGVEKWEWCAEGPYMSRMTMGPRAQHEGRPTQVVFPCDKWRCHRQMNFTGNLST